MVVGCSYSNELGYIACIHITILLLHDFPLLFEAKNEIEDTVCC